MEKGENKNKEENWTEEDEKTLNELLASIESAKNRLKEIEIEKEKIKEIPAEIEKGPKEEKTEEEIKTEPSGIIGSGRDQMREEEFADFVADAKTTESEKDENKIEKEPEPGVKEKVEKYLNEELDLLNKRLEEGEIEVPNTAGTLIIKLDSEGNFLDAGSYGKDGYCSYKTTPGSVWENRGKYGEQAIINTKRDYPKVKKIWDEWKRRQNILKSELTNKIVLLATKLGGLKELGSLLSKNYTYEEIGPVSGLKYSNSIESWLTSDAASRLSNNIEKIIDKELENLEKNK